MTYLAIALWLAAILATLAAMSRDPKSEVAAVVPWMPSVGDCIQFARHEAWERQLVRRIAEVGVSAYRTEHWIDGKWITPPELPHNDTLSFDDVRKFWKKMECP